MYTRADLQEKENYLRHVLRRHPESLGLRISADGWVSTAELLTRANSNGQALTMDDILDIMKETATEYSFKNGTDLIRANYGHSLRLKLRDLVGAPSVPEGNLYHGTAVIHVDKIMEQGVLPQRRDHVFLTSDPAKANEYGFRHGRPAIIEIDTKKCMEKNCELFHPCSHIWLAHFIPPECIHTYHVL